MPRVHTPLGSECTCRFKSEQVKKKLLPNRREISSSQEAAVIKKLLIGQLNAEDLPGLTYLTLSLLHPNMLTWDLLLWI